MYTECPFVALPYPPDLIEAGRRLLHGILNDVKTGCIRRLVARFFARRALKRLPMFAEEMRLAAETVAASPVDMMQANISYDLLLGMFGCSTMALATPDGPVLARNMDWLLPDLIARASCVTATPHGLNASAVGAVGVVSGMSKRGFAVVLNAVIAGKPNKNGFPVMLFLRYLLDEADSFAAAVRMTTETPLATAALITLVGTENRERVCVERLPTVAAPRWADGDAPLICTNHYRTLAKPETCDRYDYLRRCAPALLARPTDADLLGLLRDERVLQPITAQHIIARPARNELRLYVPSAWLTGPRRGDVGLRELRRLL
jgi:hypothetical protein